MKRHFRIAHLSDVHLSPLQGVRWQALTNQRILGYVNWRRNRHKVHVRERLDLLLHDIRLHEPDHVAVTGDLVNLGLPEEFIAAMKWLEELGPPEYVSVVPGNHDAYVRLRNDPGFRRWMPYMTSNKDGMAYLGGGGESGGGGGKNKGSEASGGKGYENGFPFVKKFGDVALIGLSSAVPTMPFMASGKLGKGQIARADEVLAKTGADNLCRLVLIHHPPVISRSNWYRGLSDSKNFGRVAKSHGAELILHGHWHTQSTNHIDGPNGHIPIMGVPSASSGMAGHKPLARYNLYDFYLDNGAWSAQLTGRGFSDLEGSIHTIESRKMDLSFGERRESEIIAH